MSSIAYNFLPKEKARAKLKYYMNCYVKKEDIILAVIALLQFLGNHSLFLQQILTTSEQNKHSQN